MGERGEINLYYFVANNPVYFCDPYGLYTAGEWIEIISAGASGWGDAAGTLGGSLGGTLAGVYDGTLGDSSLVNGDLNYGTRGNGDYNSGNNLGQNAYDGMAGYLGLPTDPNDPNACNGQGIGAAASLLNGGGGAAICCLRSKLPPAIRNHYNTMKKAYDAAKQAGHKNEPVKHSNDPNQPPHFHPGDGKGKPASHDHYYY